MDNPTTKNKSSHLLTIKGVFKTRKNPSKRSITKNHSIEAVVIGADKSIDENLRLTLVIEYIREQFLLNNVRHLPEWERLTTKTKAVIHHMALRLMAEEQGMIAAPFTLNVTTNIIEEMEHDEVKAVKKLNNNLRQKLRRATGRHVQHYLTIEVDAEGTKLGRPHIHGTMLLTPKEASAAYKSNPVKRAMHSVNQYGEASDFKRFSLKIKNEQADTNWASYSTKQIGKNRLYLPNTKPLYSTQSCTKEAVKLWNQMREWVNNPYPVTKEELSQQEHLTASKLNQDNLYRIIGKRHRQS